MGDLGKICRLCFKKCDNFESIIGNAKENLDILLPEMDLIKIKEPAMCSNCAETLVKCVDFKTMCFNTYNSITPLVNNKGKKLDLVDVYLNIKECVTSLQEDHNICGLCISPVKNCSALPLIGDFILEKMIEKCLPELDISIIKKPVICASCHESLKNCFRFLTNCLVTEEKIKKYCDGVGNNCEGLIELSSVLQFTIRDISIVACDTVEAIKVEEQFCEEIENFNEVERANGSVLEKSDQKLDLQQFPLKNLLAMGDIDRLIKLEDTGNASVKVECDSNVAIDDQKYNYAPQFKPHILICKEEGNKVDQIKIEESESKDNKDLYFPIKYVEIKPDAHDFNRLHDRVVLPQPEVTSKLLPTIREKVSEPPTKPTLKNKKVSKVTMHRCAHCSYQTKYKKDLNTHSLVHKNPSEITMYQCESCPFQAKHKNYLRKHSLMHKNESELTMHQCESCSYQTKYKQNIRKHSLVHKSPSEITMHQCDTCSYQSKYKRALDRHKLTHTDLMLQNSLLDVPLLKCEFCSFRTKRNYRLKSHMLTHKHQSEVTMYQCDFCPYQTRHKSSLSLHNVIHKDESEITMYSCESCSFQTKHKRVLRAHILTHKNPSEVTMYQCQFCSFQTKRKHYLKVHLLVHKNPSEVTMYQCESCSFQTKRKSTIRKHLLLHNDLSVK